VAALPDVLGVLAGYTTLRGDESLARQLTAAAGRLRGMQVPDRRAFLKDLYEHGADGWTADVVTLVRRIIDDGRDSVLAAFRTRLAPDLARLLAVPGVDLADVVTVHRRTGAITAGDLAAAVSTLGHPVTDIDDGLRQRIETALPALRSGHPRIPLGRAITTLDRIAQRMREQIPSLDRPIYTGSVRRFEPTVGDLEMVVPSEEPERVLEALQPVLDPTAILHRSARRLSMHVDGHAITMRVVRPPALPFALLYYTGAGEHVHGLQRRAAERGWRLTPEGLFGASAPPCGSEGDIYEALGLAFVAPELRSGERELVDAAAGPLPSLISRGDIRGDLHVHTLWSDGRDSVETMVRAAKLLGYQYVAITDHSQGAAASRVLTLDRIERHFEEVASVRTRVSDITVLQGAEVDILPDGSLDFPDHILDRLDIVLASLHEPAGQTPDVLLERYIRAMRHPRVHIITHPANRLVGRDEGYPLDFDALFREAVATGTILEVDGGPAHLDMDGRLARRAVAAGVMVSVDSDCHNAARLELQMTLGIGTARRGGLEPRHVINTRTLDEVRAFFASKPDRLAARPA
jgi:DNA polymerase (family 10)